MRKLILIPLMSALLFGAGCSSNPTLTGLRDSAAIETLFVYGTLKAIEKASEPVAKAGRIRDVARQFQEAAAAESVRSALLAELLQEVVAERDLSAADRYLVSQVDPLITHFAGEDGYIVGERKAALVAFLEEVIRATSFYTEGSL